MSKHIPFHDGTSAAQLAPVHDAATTILGGFTELAAALLSDERLAGWTRTAVDTDIVSLSKDGLAQIFLAPSVWTDDRRIGPFLSGSSTAGTLIVLIGSLTEVASPPEELRRPQLQFLATPCGLDHALGFVQALHNTQSLVARAEDDRRVAADANDRVKHVLSISRELAGERNIPKLLSLVLAKAREVTRADAGSIYTVDSPTDNVRDGTIRFHITQNNSIQQNLSEFTMPVSETSIVGNAVIHATAINIPDLYRLSSNPAENPYGAVHDRSWDLRTGYECHSMLTVPLFNIAHEVIGAIQLINHKRDLGAKLTSPEDFAQQVTPFTADEIEYVGIVAQQAGIALENAKLTKDKEDLFEGFVKASITAIEQRDPTTSGHSQRVCKLTLEIARNVNRVSGGPLGDIHFDDDGLKEIEYAALLHDIGKVGVRERVLVKAKKLYPWQMDLLLERFELIRASIEIEYLKSCNKYYQAPNSFPMGVTPHHFERLKAQKLRELDELLEFIHKVNQPTVLEEGGFERLKDVLDMSFLDPRGNPRPYLLTDEMNALSIARGSLTREEFSEIQSHVTHTYEFLRKIPWGKKLANIPQIAAMHHEKLDGSGYPTAARIKEIPVQTRIMTISDIFDALTAADRPYKKAVPVPRALEILEMDVKNGKVDDDLFRLFIESQSWKCVTEG